MSRKLIDANCLQCGRQFWVRKGATNSQRFCSRSCASFWQGLQSSQKVTKACLVCKKSFQVRSCEVLKIKTCSKECSGKYRSFIRLTDSRLNEISRSNGKLAKGRTFPELRKKPIERVCRQCQKVCYVPYKDRDRIFCSVKCVQDYFHDDRSRTPGWRGGITPYYGENWKQQSRAARKRDRYICQDCGRYQWCPGLDVHHIIPLREFGSDWKTANQLHNLVTLCKSCHSKRPED